MEIFLCSVIFPSWHKQQFLGTALKILRMPFLPISLPSFLFLFAHDCLRPHHEINHPHLLPRSSVAPDSTLSPLQPVTETRGNRVPKEEERSTGNERAQQPLRAHPPISQQTDRSDRAPPRPGGCSSDQTFLPSRTKLSPIRFHQASPRFSGDRRAGNHNIFAYSLLLGVTSVLTWV